MLSEIIVVSLVWCGALFIGNPFLEGPKRKYAMIGFAILASVAYVLNGGF